MSDSSISLLLPLAGLALWFVLMRFVLPRLGFST
jgi:hypothetical protein